MLLGLVKDFIEGLVGPVFTYLGKRSDNQLDGFKAGASVDQAIEINRVQAELETNRIRATLILGSPVFKLVNWIAGPITAVYYFCVVVDTIQGSFTHHFVGIASLPGAFGDRSWTILFAYLVAQTTQHGIATFADAWRGARSAPH